MSDDNEDEIIRGIIADATRQDVAKKRRTDNTLLRTILIFVLGFIACCLIFALGTLLGSMFLPGVDMIWLPWQPITMIL